MEKTEKEWQDNADEISIIDLVYEYVRYWKWFILSILVCVFIGFVIVLVSQKQYKSTISVLLNEDKNATGQSNSSGLSLDELGLLSSTTNIDNEIAILTSPDLMRGVVDSLNLTTSYCTRSMFRDKELYSESPFYVTYAGKTDSFPDIIDLTITKSGNKYLVQGEYTVLKKKTEFTKEIKNFPARIQLGTDSTYLLNIKLTGKKAVEDEDYRVVISNPSFVVRNLELALSVVQTSKMSSALNLSLLVNNTEKGAAILRELVRQYNIQNIKVNNQIAYNTAIFINERLKEISVELSDVERDVVDYKQQNRIADLPSEAQLSIQESGQNKQRLMDIETQLNVINMVDKFVNDPSSEMKIIPNLGVSDPALAQVIGDYNNKLLSSENLLKGTGEENPMRKRVLEEIANMRNSISSSLRNVRQAYNISKQDMQRLSGSTTSRIQSIPQQEKGLLERVRQQQVKENLFLFLMQKREETNISIASISDKARIIASPQIDLLPVAPKTNIILLAAFILGILIPVVVIYILNMLRTKIGSRSELEKLSKVNVIGQVNDNKTNDHLITKTNPDGVTAELFRALRNNLNFILKNNNHRVIIVTSTVSGEGKTFISANIAITYASSGKKVLLIGADIRKPKLKDYLNLQGRRGLTDYLVDTSDDWRSYVIKPDISPNLDVIISGSIPPNPNELLMSPKLNDFLLSAKGEYDFVILDTAPVGMVSDTYLINENVDVTLYVVREKVTPKNAVSFINAQKQENRLPNMYLVLNGSSLDKYSGYKYGYSKGYGYGEKRKNKKE